MQKLCGMTKEEIIGMMSAIRNICSSNECGSCPFGNGGDGCKMQDTPPESWSLPSDDDFWRAIL